MAVKKKKAAPKKKAVKKKITARKPNVAGRKEELSRVVHTKTGNIDPRFLNVASEVFVNRKQLTWILGVSEKTVTQYGYDENNPLPFERDGKENKYNMQEVIKWHERRIAAQYGVAIGERKRGSYEGERTRLAAAQADGQELKNAITRKEQAPIILLEKVLTDVARQIGAVFGSIKMIIKNKLPHLTAKELEIIEREVVKAQNAAADIKIDLGLLADSDK